MNRHTRLLRRLLSLYPRSFRERYEDEMICVFRDELRHVGTRRDVVVLWLRTIVDLVLTAPREHARAERAVRQPAANLPVSSFHARRPPPSSTPDRILALAPLWGWLILLIAAGDYASAVFMNPPSVAGLPLGIILLGVAWAWMLLGMPVIWRPRSSTRLNVALAVFTLPAVVVALVAPAVLRVLVNLG